MHASSVLIGVLVLLGSSLSPGDDARAQGAPGYRMRMPVGASLGAPAGVPRLTGIPPSDPSGSGRRVQSFFPYYSPYYWPFGFYDGGYAEPGDSAGEGYSAETQRVPVQPAHDVDVVYDSMPAVQPLQVSALVGSKPMVRLTWRDSGVGAKQVAFFLTDSARAVLSAQTVLSPPFTALFEPTVGAAFAGMTVVLPGGTLVTQYQPYRPATSD